MSHLTETIDVPAGCYAGCYGAVIPVVNDFDKKLSTFFITKHNRNSNENCSHISHCHRWFNFVDIWLITSKINACLLFSAKPTYLIYFTITNLYGLKCGVQSILPTHPPPNKNLVRTWDVGFEYGQPPPPPMKHGQIDFSWYRCFFFGTQT